MSEIILDEIDYFLNDIEHFCLNSKSEKAFNAKDRHLFVGISPFNKYFSKEQILLIAKTAQTNFESVIFFYVGNLAEYTLKILEPNYDEKQIQKKLKKQNNLIKNRVTEVLTLLNYTEKEIKDIYITFEDIKDNPIFIQNFKKTLETYEKEDNKLKNFCDKFIVDNAVSMKISEDNKHFFYQYLLNEIALIRSAAEMFNKENISICYHKKELLKSLFDERDLLGFDDRCSFQYFFTESKKSFINNFVDNSVNVFIVDKDFKYRYVSDSMLKNLSICENEIVYKTFFEVFGYENLNVKENDKKVIFEASTIETEEYEIINNKIKYFKVIKKPLYNKNKEVIGLIGTSMDITEIKEAQIKAEKEKYEESLFNENYIHELNNILHKQRQIKFLLNGSTVSEKDRIILSEILEFENSKFFYITENFTLHNNYLSQDKKILLQKKLTNIIGLIEKEIIYFNLYYKYLNQNRLIIFEKDLDDYGLMVDEVKISQLVHNLIKNADKHSESTEIKIKFKILNDNFVISIEDNGKGIDSHINKEDLFIVDKDKKITKSGSGLGLPICKSIVNHHDGNIYFKETEKGTAIEFFLPL